MNSDLFKKKSWLSKIFVIIKYFSFSDYFTSYKQVKKMRASKVRDLLKDENGHAVTTPRHGATAGAGSMGRKVEAKEFELSTKLKKLV